MTKMWKASATTLVFLCITMSVIFLNPLSISLADDDEKRESGRKPPAIPPEAWKDTASWAKYVRDLEDAVKNSVDWANHVRDLEYQRMFQGKNPTSEWAPPAPRPSSEPKPEYGPFPEGDPRNNPPPKKSSPPPPGVGPYGPEPLPNPSQAKAPLQFDGLLGKWGMNRGAGSQVLGHAFKQDTSAGSSSALKADCNLG